MKRSFTDLNDLVDYCVTELDQDDPHVFTVTKGKLRTVQSNRTLWHFHSIVSDYTGQTKDEVHWYWKANTLVDFIDTRYPELNLKHGAEHSQLDQEMIEPFGEPIPSTYYYFIKDSVRSRDLENSEFKEILQDYEFTIAKLGLRT